MKPVESSQVKILRKHDALGVGYYPNSDSSNTSSVIKTAWVEIPGGTIHYRAGVAFLDESPVVLLIHGLVVGSTYMVPTAEAPSHERSSSGSFDDSAHGLFSR